MASDAAKAETIMVKFQSRPDLRQSGTTFFMTNDSGSPPPCRSDDSGEFHWPGTMPSTAAAQSAGFGTQQHWELRAREARAMADSIGAPDAKRAMLGIAENYEKIAKRAEAKEARVPMAGRPPLGA
jgi:hypothetical protein